MEAPPKMTERIAAELLAPVRREPGREGEHALTGKDAFASLPVLGAVRQFIDSERRRTRRMILTLVLLFAVILMAFIGAFIFVAEIQMRRVKADLDNGQKTIAAAASQIGMLKQELTEEAQRLNLRLADGGKQAESALEAVRILDASITNAVVELQLLKQNMGSVDVLKGQSKTALGDLESKWNTLSIRLDALSRQNSMLMARLVEKGEKPSYEPVVATTAAPDTGIVLDLAPSNTEHRINWRLPLP